MLFCTCLYLCQKVFIVAKFNATNTRTRLMHFYVTSNFCYFMMKYLLLLGFSCLPCLEVPWQFLLFKIASYPWKEGRFRWPTYGVIQSLLELLVQLIRAVGFSLSISFKNYMDSNSNQNYPKMKVYGLNFIEARYEKSIADKNCYLA